MAQVNSEKIFCQEKFLFRKTLIPRLLDNHQLINHVSVELHEWRGGTLHEMVMPPTNCFSVTSARWRGNFSLTSGVKSSIFPIQNQSFARVAAFI